MTSSTTQESMRCLMSREGSIAILTIDNQARRNALSAPVRDEMHAHMNQLIADKSCRAIIITGAGGFFSAGGDVKAMRERNNQPQPMRLPEAADMVYGRETSGGSSGLMRLLIAGPKPIISAVDGGAFGVGLGLMAAADYIVTTPNARFQAAQVRRGLQPDGGMYYTITARCGIARARELLVSGREFNGEAAERYGIVDELVEPGEVMAAAMRAAERYAELPPVSVAISKTAMAYNHHTLDAAIEAEHAFGPILHATRDHAEAVAAFLEKRKPIFTGE